MCTFMGLNQRCEFQSISLYLLMPNKDKQKQKECAAKHYLAHKEQMIAKAAANNKVARERNIAFVNEYLATHPCVDCPESDPIVLEFDHVRGKKHKEVSDMAQKAYSIKTIEEEIAKCEVRCANCHRRVTYYRRLNQCTLNELNV